MRPQVRIVPSPSDVFQVYTGSRSHRRWLLGFVPKGQGDALIPSWGLHREAAIVLVRSEAERIAATVDGRLFGPL